MPRSGTRVAGDTTLNGEETDSPKGVKTAKLLDVTEAQP